MGMRLAQVARPAGSPPGCAEIITGAGMLLIGRTSIYFNAKSVLTSVVEMTISRCGSSLAFHTGQEEEEKVGRYTAQCVHWTVGYPCSIFTPVYDTGVYFSANYTPVADTGV